MLTKQQKAIEYFDGCGSQYDGYLIDLIKRDTQMKVNDEKVDVKALDVDSNEVVTFECTPCPKCTKWLLIIDNFCKHCGQRIKK